MKIPKLKMSTLFINIFMQNNSFGEKQIPFQSTFLEIIRDIMQNNSFGALLHVVF